MHSQKTNTRVIVILVAAAFVLASFFALQPRASRAAALTGSDSGYVAVQFGPSQQEIRSINFTAPISGLAALELAGYPIETVDFGGGFIAVCSINGVGCPAANCFCDPTHFWNYEYWDGSQWAGYLVGASSSSISDGAIEGWRWAEFGVGSLPDAPQLIAASNALGWLAQQQSTTDGGYGGYASSLESMFAIGANGLPASSWRRSAAAPSLLSYIYNGASAYSKNGAANAGKLALAFAASESCTPIQTQLPQDYYLPASGRYAADAGVHSWAMIGAAALDQAVPPAAVAYLKSLQQSDGGWEWTPGGFGNGTDTNTTALATQALIAAGEPNTSTAITAAIAYLHAAQNDDGGFPYDADSPYGTDSDANSTAYVSQALSAAGEDPSSWAPAGSSVSDYLLSLQLPDGSLEWQPGLGANLLATQQAIPALLGKPYPLAARAVSVCPTVNLPFVINQ